VERFVWLHCMHPLHQRWIGPGSGLTDWRACGRLNSTVLPEQYSRPCLSFSFVWPVVALPYA
jgi:hypothetical protein